MTTLRSPRELQVRKVFLVLGTLAAAIYLTNLESSSTLLKCLTKPVPILLMATWVFLTQSTRMARLIGMGLVLGAVGDIILLFPGDTPFVAGLAVFLLAHLLYIASFVSDYSKFEPARAVFPLLAVCGLYALSWPRLGGMAVPVAAYCLTIGCMMWRALARVGRSEASAASHWAGAIGALIFASSDSLIAIDKFYVPIEHVGYAIMVTYYVGQLGITTSARRE